MDVEGTGRLLQGGAFHVDLQGAEKLRGEGEEALHQGLEVLRGLLQEDEGHGVKAREGEGLAGTGGLEGDEGLAVGLLDLAAGVHRRVAQAASRGKGLKEALRLPPRVVHLPHGGHPVSPGREEVGDAEPVQVGPNAAAELQGGLPPPLFRQAVPPQDGGRLHQGEDPLHPLHEAEGEEPFRVGLAQDEPFQQGAPQGLLLHALHAPLPGAEP